MDAESDHEQHHRYLYHDDGRVEAGALLDAHYQDAGDHQGDDECRQVEPDFHAKQMWRIQQIVRAPQQHRRLRRHDFCDFIEKCLRARDQRGVGSLRHLARDDVFRLRSRSNGHRPARAAS